MFALSQALGGVCSDHEDIESITVNELPNTQSKMLDRKWLGAGIAHARRRQSTHVHARAAGMLDQLEWQALALRNSRNTDG